jgi:hypothetical protein
VTVNTGTSGLTTLAQNIYNQTQTAANFFATQTAIGSINSSGTAAGSISGSSGSYNLTYSGPAGGVAVYNINASALTGSDNLNLSALSTGGAGTVIIDVTGTLPANFNFNNTNFTGDFDAQFASKVLFDFGSYTGSITNGRELFGAILAPDAILANTNAIDGSVWVQSINAQGEIHQTSGGFNEQYTGFDPNAVPEPSTLVLTGFSIFFGGLYQWMRSRSRLRRLMV